MQRSDSLIRLVSVVVFLALAAYIGVSAYTSGTQALKTVLATDMELRESVMTEGFAVRRETVLTSPSGTVFTVAGNGQRVSSGESVARSYTGSDALRRADEIRELTLQIEQLEDIIDGKGGAKSAKESIMALAGLVASGDLSQLDAAALDVDTYIISGGERLKVSDEQLSSMKARLSSLQSNSHGTENVLSPGSGVFTSALDGYESVTPDMLTSSLTPTEARKLFSSPADQPAGAFGKLISGMTWYYVTEVDTKTAAKLSDVSGVKVEFSKTYSGTVTMKVENVGVVEEGRCAVVLSCDRALRETASLRELTGEIIFSAESGVKIPKEAVHLDEEGTCFVYLLEGMQAQRTDVTIMGEDELNYMAEKTGSGIRAGDKIITRASDLYDGAVVITSGNRVF